MAKKERNKEMEKKKKTGRDKDGYTMNLKKV